MEKLENHIDTPIKKCVVGLNLLGIRTMFSCCGFTYKNEEVPKGHLDKAYMYIDLKTSEFDSRILLLEIACRSKWILFPLDNGIIDFYAPPWERDHPWNNKKSPHFYEKFVIGIHCLEKVLDEYVDKFKSAYTIVDGNTNYTNNLKMKYWQYEPCEPWVVTPEIYKNL